MAWSLEKFDAFVKVFRVGAGTEQTWLQKGVDPTATSDVMGTACDLQGSPIGRHIYSIRNHSLLGTDGGVGGGFT